MPEHLSTAAYELYRAVTCNRLNTAGLRLVALAGTAAGIGWYDIGAGVGGSGNPADPSHLQVLHRHLADATVIAVDAEQVGEHLDRVFTRAGLNPTRPWQHLVDLCAAAGWLNPAGQPGVVPTPEELPDLLDVAGPSNGDPFDAASHTADLWFSCEAARTRTSRLPQTPPDGPPGRQTDPFSFAGLAYRDWVDVYGVDGVDGHTDTDDCGCGCGHCTDDYIHAADSDTLAAHGEGDYDGPVAGRTVCGKVGYLGIPGVFTRMGAPRCPECARGTNLPDGVGSPKNDPLLRPLLGLT